MTKTCTITKTIKRGQCTMTLQEKEAYDVRKEQYRRLLKPKYRKIPWGAF